MTALPNPALEKFVASFGDELLFAQVLIRRQGRAYSLRHVGDRKTPETELRVVAVPDLREVAQTAAAGAFRPLKSAPNLRLGWRTSRRAQSSSGRRWTICIRRSRIGSRWRRDHRA
jgi:hypothetical protein